jgi:membrane-bound lytic murein transglycosylase C
MNFSVKKVISNVYHLLVITFFICVGYLYCSPVNASTTDEFDALQARMNAEFNQYKSKQANQFKALQKNYLTQLNRAKKLLSPKWDDPLLTSKNIWVEYSDSDDVRRRVDYKTGEIAVEILGDNLSKAEINQVVEKQLILLKNETTMNAAQKDKVISSSDKKLATQIPNSQKMLPNLDISALKKQLKISSFHQKNGQKITMITMKNTKKYIVKKGDSYLPAVLKIAKKWNVEPSLILAIMYTESHFNPLAQSHVPAYGLMQVVPTSAGRDVTRFYMGGEKVLKAGELFDPEFNINVGTAYLNILQAKYLKKVKNPQARVYLAIAAYNGGIGAVAKHFSGKASLIALANSVNKLSPEQVYHSLETRFPAKETRDYLTHVTGRQQYYRNYLIEKAS